MLKHLQLFANSENSLFALYCVRTVSKRLPPEPCCVKTPDISLARRLILSSASLFICNVSVRSEPSGRYEAQAKMIAFVDTKIVSTKVDRGHFASYTSER